MAGSFQRLGRLWFVSKYSSLSGCGGGYLMRVNHSTVKAVTARAFGGISYNQFRSLSDGPGPGSDSSKGKDDRIQFFMHPEVQNLLKELTGKDLKRVFRKRKIGQKIREPKYTFMTESQLEEAKKESEAKAEKLLQMPPVLRPRKPIETVLAFDPQLQAEERSTLIFTDITMNVDDRDRIIVARDADGTLRQATWEERDKMNAIYFPVRGREFLTPKMFTDPEILQNTLNRVSEEDNTYEFVLDRACLQFEPDDPLYISTVEATYDAVDRNGHYDLLKSTRHFGPMTFYLVRMRKMDGLLLHSLRHGRVTTDATKLVSMFHILFPECKSKCTAGVGDIEKLSKYIQLDAIRKGELELSLNAYLEERAREAELEEGFKRQHGIQS